MSTSMYCETATEMVRGLKNSKKWLPPYQEDGIRKVIKECDDLYRQLYAAVEAAQGGEMPRPVQTTTMVNQLSLFRNKRLTLAYLNHRKNKLVDLWWDAGSVLPEEAEAVLSPSEKTLYSEYDQLVNDYMSTTGITLTAHMTPPKSVWVEVRVERAYGEVLTSVGMVKLEKDSVHVMRRADAEILIRQGVLKAMDKEAIKAH